MTEREYEYFTARDRACVEYKRELAAQAEQAEATRDVGRSAERASSSIASALFVTTLIGTLITLLAMNS